MNAVALAAWLFLPVAQPPAPPTDDPEKIRAEIARDMETVERKLKERDAGDDTRGLQKRILENLDKLLEQAKNPPPQDQQQNPMGGSSQKSNSQKSMDQSSPSSGQQKTGSSSSMTRRQRREARRREREQAKSGQQPGSPSGQSSQQASGAGNQNNRAPMGKMSVRTGPPQSMADVAKDIWGHLPEALRQEVDHYYKEQFMPRYRDLLQQYYLRLAETERRGPGE